MLLLYHVLFYTICFYYLYTFDIVSISSYEGAREFLLRESDAPDLYSTEEFSLIKLSYGNKCEEIIAQGSAQELYSSFNSSGKKVLNG